jgi:ATP-dependent DNA ligase
MTLGNMGWAVVAKRRDSRYRPGRCRDWIKIKNIAHPAIERAMLIALTKTAAATRVIEG